MRIIIMYDIDTTTAEGKIRMRKMATACLNLGIRIQNSVYECSLDAKEYREATEKLQEIIDPIKDSLRFYNLGKKLQNKILHYGAGITDVFEDFVF